MGVCTLYPQHPDRCDTINAVHKTFSSISLISSFVIVVLLILIKEYKMSVQRMILFMVISAFLSSVAYLIGNVDSDDDHTCRFQAFMMQYFDWAVLMWVFMICVNMVLTVKHYQTAKFSWIYHVVVWVVSLIMAVIPFFKNTYGHAGLWCWIKRDYTGYRFGTWFGPLLVICTLMFIILLYVIMQVYQSTKAQFGHTDEVRAMNKRYRDELRPLLFYPLMYVLFSIPTLMYRIEDAAHPSRPPNYALIVIAAIFGPSVGAANAVIFAIVNLKSIRNLTWSKVKNMFVLSLTAEEQTHVVHDIQVENDPENSTTSNSSYGQ